MLQNIAFKYILLKLFFLNPNNSNDEENEKWSSFSISSAYDV